MSTTTDNKSSTQNACVICFEQFTNQRLIVISCGHIFCFQCLFDWSSKKEICPICVKPCPEINDYLKRIKKYEVNWHSLVENNPEPNPQTEYKEFVNEITDDKKNSSMTENEIENIEMDLEEEPNYFNNGFEKTNSEEEMEDICDTLVMTSLDDFDYSEFD